MKEICKRLNIDTKIYKERSLLAAISSAKDELVSPTQFALQASASSDFAKKKQAQVYQEYQAALQKNNALDFDDLIVKTVELLQTDPEVLAYYQERFRYIMVDEYQDTNTAQFELIRLLAGKYKNLCVVGDDDQSIYKFRGANIYNILNFEKHFPDAVTIKLEQNYRSTQNILNAANSVIANNVGRKAKTLWTANGEGEKIDFEQFDTAYEEADYVARDIASGVRDGKYGYGDYAVLYRTNAQSRLFEERFIVSNIPYKIVGGVNFYARKEVKDLLAYLKTIDNARDDLAVRRIINVPKRGIGATTLNRVSDYAEAYDISFYESLKRAEEIPSLGKSATKIKHVSGVFGLYGQPDGLGKTACVRMYQECAAHAEKSAARPWPQKFFVLRMRRSASACAGRKCACLPEKTGTSVGEEENPVFIAWTGGTGACAAASDGIHGRDDRDEITVCASGGGSVPGNVCDGAACGTLERQRPRYGLLAAARLQIVHLPCDCGPDRL